MLNPVRLICINSIELTTIHKQFMRKFKNSKETATFKEK